MEFDNINIQKIDSTGNYRLHDDYILSYEFSDGWTERSLRVSFYIDLIYDCKVDICYYQTARRNRDSNFKRQFEIKVPENIKILIEQLVNQDTLNLKQIYADTFMEDSREEHFVINHNKKSHNISIGIREKKIIKNEAEKIFFKLHDRLEKWREEIYQSKII